MTDYADIQADLITMMPDSTIDPDLMLRFAHADMNRLMRVQGMMKTATLTPVLTGERYIKALPADFIELFHVEQGGTRLELRSPNAYDVDDADIYAIVGTDIHVTGVTDINIWYYGKVTTLSGSITSNLFSTSYYDILLYMCLAHSYAQQNRMELAANQRNMAIGLIADAQMADSRARFRGAPLIQGGGA